MKKPFAYITAVWKGGEFTVIDQAAVYCRKVYEAGFTPICPVLYLPHFLRDSIPAEHKDGIDIGRELLRRSHVLIVCGDEVDESVKNDIAVAQRLGIIMSFCELILSAAQGGLKPIEKSVIDRCIPKIYRQLIKDPRPENMPILGDLYECLRAQQEEQAQELATALELYVFGSLNYLNHRTNVNVDNRVACYDISGLGQNLKKPGMLTVQNNIWQRTIVNRYAGKTTRIYLDEFHLLLKEPQTAAYTAEIYKRFRKWNGIPTSLTQNVKDLLESPEIENILENSDFILMLNQAASDRNILAQRLGISPQELGHITNSDAGEGLLFFGDKIIPFVDKFPTDTKLYQVMTTKPADLAA